MGFDTTGIKRLVASGRKLDKIFSEEVDSLADKVGKDFYDTARKNQPRPDTGRLAASWSKSKETVGKHGRALAVENSAPYARYVEYGHKVKVHGKEVGYVKGRYFLKKSRRQVSKRLSGYYDDMIDRIEGRLSQ